MYHTIIKSKIRHAFQLVNDHAYAQVADGLALNIRHIFSGDHALGGARHDVAAVKAWFERVGRVLPTLQLTITDILVQGWPHNTRVLVQWTAAASLLDGGTYVNHGVHLVRVRWGKITEMLVYEDSQAVARALEQQYAAGMLEAKAPPISS